MVYPQITYFKRPTCCIEAFRFSSYPSQIGPKYL